MSGRRAYSETHCSIRRFMHEPLEASKPVIDVADGSWSTSGGAAARAYPCDFVRGERDDH